MKPGCILHPFLTGIILFRSSKKTLWIGKMRRLKDEVEDLIRAGAQHIELNSDIIQFTPHFRKRFREKELPYLEEFIKKGLLTVSVHVDHIGYSFPPRYWRMRSGAVAQFQYLANYYSRLDLTHYTLHIGPDEMFRAQVFKNLPIIKILPFKKISISKKIKNIAIEEILREAPQAFEELKNEAGIDLNKICVENMEGMRREEFDELFKEMVKMVPEIGCILDVGHLLMEEYLEDKHCLENFIKYWGKKKKKLKAVHIHDVAMSFNNKNKKLIVEAIAELKKENRNKDDLVIRKLEEFMRLSSKQKAVFADHQNLGTGILNLPSLLKALKEANFNGPVIFEGASQKGFLDSVRLLAKEIEKVKKSK